MDKQVLAIRLRDLAAYLDRTPEPDWRWVRVELEAMARMMYRLAPSPLEGEGRGGGLE